MDSPLNVLSDLSERVNYNLSGLPLYIMEDELSRYSYKALCHWHPNLEFIRISKGTMDYFINGKNVRLQQGQGILSTAADSTMVFRHKKILDAISHIYCKMHTVPLNPLHLLSEAVSICAGMGDHIETMEINEKDKRMQMAFLNMTEFIHKNYQRKLTLDMIANAGAVCRSKGCQLFQQYVRQTPTACLTKYRIVKSTELLRDTDLSVTEISLHCVFKSLVITSAFSNGKQEKRRLIIEKQPGCKDEIFYLINLAVILQCFY